MLDFENGSMNWADLEKKLDPNIKGTEKKDYNDSRIWSLSRDENDNGAAIIRLLVDPNGIPYIKRFSHAISSYDRDKKKTQWYLNVSPQTINLPCPASDFWSLLYNFGTNEAKLEAKNFSRKIKFMTNIKVIKDPANPQNEGKIFLWEFGTKLHDKITQALNPSESDRAMGDTPKELFNPLKGCNIKLKIKKAAGFLNYDDTTIEAQSSIYSSGDEARKDILSNAYKLEEFQQENSFDPFDELKSKLKWVIDKYEVKHMDKLSFQELVKTFFGVDTKFKKTELVINSGLDLGDVKPAPTSAPKQVPKDDDLAFLDEL